MGAQYAPATVRTGSGFLFFADARFAPKKTLTGEGQGQGGSEQDVKQRHDRALSLPVFLLGWGAVCDEQRITSPEIRFHSVVVWVV